MIPTTDDRQRSSSAYDNNATNNNDREEMKINDDDNDGVEQQQQQSIPEETAATGGVTTDDKNKNDEVAGDDEQREKKTCMKVSADAPWKDRMWEVFTTFWPLGFLAFGGPAAHIALLRDHLVVQRDWVDDEQFQELFAIGQGLPGPTSTQLVVSTALSRAGPLGGLLAFVLWSLPGLIALTLFGVVIDAYIDPNNPPWYLIGLPPAAVALVFYAFYSFAIKLDRLGIALALFTCLATILINNDADIQPTSSQWLFPSMLFAGGLITLVDSRRAKPFSNYGSPSKGWEQDNEETMKRIGIPLWVGAVIFFIWLGVLVASIIIVKSPSPLGNNVYMDIFETMYRIGSIIYGGGQVVLPMLQDEVVGTWMTKDQFLQGLGLAQSMPGPLFNFSAYLGAVYQGVPGAMVGFVGIFAPGNILIFAAVPYWAKLRHIPAVRAILSGVNSAAVGLVGAACAILWESAITTAADAMVFAIALTFHVSFSIAAPFCIIIGGIAGAILHPDALNMGQVPYCIDQGFANPAGE